MDGQKGHSFASGGGEVIDGGLLLAGESVRRYRL